MIIRFVKCDTVREKESEINTVKSCSITGTGTYGTNSPHSRPDSRSAPCPHHIPNAASPSIQGCLGVLPILPQAKEFYQKSANLTLLPFKKVANPRNPIEAPTWEAWLFLLFRCHGRAEVVSCRLVC